MCTRNHHHSIFCILPPHVLRHIAEKGSADERNAALNTLASDSSFRAIRAAFPVSVAAAKKHAPVSNAPAEKHRLIYDLKHTQNFPGKLVRSEGDPANKDTSVNEAYEGLGHTWDFYNEIFERNSIDDNGMTLIAAVHYGKKYDNAFWDGDKMNFGDGDGTLFNSFTAALDVIGHELTHGVTQYEAGLQYLNQAGALNESISDVFGIMIKQYVLKQDAKSADWLIGKGLLKNKNDLALRSMKAPGTAYNDPVLGKDPQPDHMSKYVHTNEDNGGVHINSGIPNKAFYLTAVAIGGYSWEKAGRIWYDTIRDPRLKTNAKFATFASLTYSNAAKLYGSTSAEAKAVAGAWKEVGVTIKHLAS